MRLSFGGFLLEGFHGGMADVLVVELELEDDGYFVVNLFMGFEIVVSY